MLIEAAVITDVGRLRLKNEDNFFLLDTYKGLTQSRCQKVYRSSGAPFQVYAVMDGMGGMKKGEAASLRAAQTLSRFIWTKEKDACISCVRALNQAVCDLHESAGESGTTLALLCVDGRKIQICNVGDSRIYRYWAGRLELLTHDHTLAQQRLDMETKGFFRSRGRGKVQEAGEGRHLLTQYLGIPPKEMLIEPYQARERKAKNGELYLLCTDGLTGMVPEQEMLACLKGNGGVKEKTERLVEAALGNGGEDNVTVMLVEIKA